MLFIYLREFFKTFKLFKKNNATWKVASLLCTFPYLEKGCQVNSFLFEALSFLLLFFFALLQIQSIILFILLFILLMSGFKEGIWKSIVSAL